MATTAALDLLAADLVLLAALASTQTTTSLLHHRLLERAFDSVLGATDALGDGLTLGLGLLAALARAALLNDVSTGGGLLAGSAAGLAA